MTVSPFTLDIETVGDTLPVELDEPLEYIERDALVHVTPSDRNIHAFYAVVEATFPDANQALVRHVSGTYMNTFCIEEIKLIYSAAARALS